MTRLNLLAAKTKKLFLYSVPDDLMNDFKRDMLEENFVRLSIVSPALFFIELILLLFEKHLMHIYFMVAFLLISLVFIPLIRHIKNNFCSLNRVFTKIVFYAYVSIALCFGAAQALGVLYEIDMTPVYLIGVFAVSLFLYIRPVPLVLLYGAVYAAFALLLPVAEAKPEMLSSMRVNTAIFNLFAWIFSQLALKSRASVFLNRKRLREQNRMLEDLTQRDAMTGLYHHAASLHLLKQEISRAQAEGHSLSLIMTDIDDFKSINDTYGHQFGDDVISLVAAVFKSMVKDKGFVGRYGGEEFLIILPGTGLDEALTLAESIQTALSCAISKPRVTVSGGVSQYCGESLNKLVRQTDEFLYIAKNSGKQRFVSTSESARTTVFRSIPM